MRPSEIWTPAAQVESPLIRVVVGSVVGYQLRPRNKARVKRELTLTIPSKAIKWMLVVVKTRWEETDISDEVMICIMETKREEQELHFLCF